MATITLDKINKVYANGYHAIHDLDLNIGDKEFLVLVGPSGCGKSTALRMIAGLEEISDGEMRIGERVVNNVEPKDRDIAMVFQNYALYPHMTVYDNIGFALKLAKVPKTEADKRIREAARVLELEAQLKRKPAAAIGWAAPTRGYGTGYRASASSVFDGRATFQLRCQATGADASGNCQPTTPTWGNNGVCNARPSRSYDHG